MNIIIPGLLSTIQDFGRYKYQEMGFPPSGVADAVSAAKANILVGNSPEEAVIEMTVLGITAEFDTPCVIAACGANMNPTLNGTPIEMYRAYSVRPGDVIAFGSIAGGGMRAYLAVSGGFDIPAVMGSRSTSTLISLGGYMGRKLQKGDNIALRAGRDSLPNMEKRYMNPDEFPKDIELRVILGPQADKFTEKGIRTFLSETYQASSAADRMGIKLEGPAIEAKSGYDIITDGIATGCIQVTGNGKPILLLPDHQTTGGYAKIATVITADLHKMGQIFPGNSVRFTEVTVKQAIKARKQLQKELAMEEKKYGI
ncbi:MAG: biotin-dependent carboxyltransferase family protein [Acetivibrionales bacterium]|jgi:antagonist of KipI